MIWFLVVLIHAVNCPGKCSEVPAVVLQMPSQDVCVAVKQSNPDVPLDCWGKPEPGGAK